MQDIATEPLTLLGYHLISYEMLCSYVTYSYVENVETIDYELATLYLIKVQHASSLKFKWYGFCSTYP